MSTQHTPGPWKMGFNSSGEQAIIGKDGAVVADASWAGGSRCELSIDNPADEKLIAAAPDLLDELKNLRRAYVNLLESGRDRIVFLGGQCDAILTMVGNDPHLKSSEAVIAKATGAT